MILHKMNSDLWEINVHDILDVYSSSYRGCALVECDSQRVIVREAVGQVKRLMKQRQEPIQLTLDL